MTDLVFLKALRDKLKGGNSRSIHLNALPGKFATRLDLADLNVVKPHLADAFLQQLFTNAKFEFPIDFHEDPAHIRPADEQKKLNILARRLNAICIENDDNFKEHGIRTFGFGYPILVKRTRQDPDKVIKAPLFIWPLEILKAHDKVNSWSILRNKTLNENNRIVDEEIHSVSINEVLLSFLRTDENIVLPQINEELLEDAVIDQEELLSLLLGVLKAFHATDTVSQAVLAAKLASPVALIPDAGELEASTGAQPWIQFSGVFGLFRTQKESIISDMDKLIDHHDLFGKPPVIQVTQPLSPYAIVDTDPSQQEILHTLLDAPHKIIQGPPGTGKSQSLTALITNALSNGMKCLVVCEKKTAMDVIKSNLERTGEALGALSVVVEDIIKDRDKIINAVRDRIAQQHTNGHVSNEHPYLQSKADIDNTIKEINTQHSALYAPLYNGKNWTTLVGEFLTMKAHTDLTPLKEKLDHRKFKFEDDPQELHTFQQHLQEAQRLYAEVNSLEHPLDLLHSRLFTGENPRLVQQELELFLQKYLLETNTLSDSLKALKAAYEQAMQDYYTTLTTNTQSLYNKLSEEVVQYGQALTQHYTAYYNAVKTAAGNYLHDADNAYRTYGDLFYKNSGFARFLLKFGSIFSGKYKRMIAARAELLAQYSRVQQAHQQFDYFPHAYLPLDVMPSLQVLPNDIRSLDEELEQWSTGIDGLKDGWVANYSPSHYHPVYSPHALQQCWKAYVSLRSRIAIDPVLQSRYGVQATHAQELLTLLKGLLADTGAADSLIAHYIDHCTSAYLHGTFKNSQPQVLQLENATSAFWNMFQQSQLFQRNVVPPEPVTLPVRMSTISRLWLEMDVVCQQLPNFRTYFAWRRFFEPLPAIAQEVICTLAVSGYPNWAEGFSAWYYNWLLSHLENLSLPTNDAAIQRLRYLQEGLKQLQQEQLLVQWQQRQTEAVQEFTNRGMSVAGLYNKRGNKGQRRNSLRKIVASDVALFTNFFPVLMVSPSVCSSILPLEEGLFDIVIFDEASQLRLEDTFPSLVRGRIKIISGDSQQMPPTAYFQGGNALLYPVEEEEEDVMPALPHTAQSLDLAESESLLMYAENSHYKPSYLKVHYRSQHPYLIDFSNHAFYGKRLIPMPARTPYKPLRYFEVAGVYDEQMNIAEARQVVQMLLTEIAPLADGRFPSVGIATFNIYQRNLILEEIIKARQESPAYDQRIRDLGPDLFVKNLENIQGDERDILIISTTYGPRKDGVFRQSFGPIQQQNGYKLLNVIITRARQAVYVVSSIPERVIQQYPLLLQQMKNNGRAVFYAYLAYAKAVETGDENTRQLILGLLAENCENVFQQGNNQLQESSAVFTKEVVRRLKERISPARIIQHYTVGGFRIDITILTADGKPFIAIECDGSKHSQRQEAYAWDLFRQQQLEQQGLRFHRIWSANWWYDPASALEQLINYIQTAEQPVNTII
ncbi:AAA domain-containing protein [Chitinophaga costaii]|uniref:AAA domain-containing protein n=1 Tax=Chitinophaga costaii TaxID=1335309 RepID=A0A1C4FCE1_9BACT|nr:AAA domain-containing protein [Chitinophaga costaii]PUZ20695.1 hypothetical protein DCM91_18195 [Chitinophaga costaii]SCC53504.1 AAA domain-containing protein [Chitinophaga costaii]